MASLYQKHALHTRRTVRFLAPEGRGDCGHLLYRFTVHPLDRIPHYAAISYVWGDPKSSGSIIIDGHSHQVTRNLLDALEKINAILESNAEVRSTGPILLWADQVCINQSDNDERGSQVSMMGSIYSLAKWVFACLGNPDAAEDVACLVDQVASQIEEDILRYQGFIELPAVDGKQVASYSHLNWTAFRDVLRLPYFSRVWIIQELGLSRRGLVVCGDRHFKLDRLMLLLKWLSYQGSRIRQQYRLPGWATQQIWASFDPKARDSEGWCKSFDFIDLLSHISCNYKATNPRDHIFGLLGHPSLKLRSYEHAGPQSLIICPDYNVSTEAVFVRFATSWLQHTDTPYLFSSVHHSTLPTRFEKGRSPGHIRKLKLPSWCPRWNHNPLGGNRLSVEGATPWYAASADSRFYWQMQPHGRLEVKGILYDEIMQTFPSLDELSIPVSNDTILMDPDLTIEELTLARKLSYLCEKILQSIERQIPVNDEDAIFEFASTVLVGSWGYEVIGDTRLDRPAQIANIKAILNVAKAELEFTRQDDFALAINMLEARCMHLNSFDAPAELSSFVQCAKTEMASRRLCTTKRGCIGLAPAIASPGDICCVISGANVPYVLRPFNEGTYLMVGACYVESIMHGEATMTKDGQSAAWSQVILE
jgi:hypothetical protein